MFLYIVALVVSLLGLVYLLHILILHAFYQKTVLNRVEEASIHSETTIYAMTHDQDEFDPNLSNLRNFAQDNNLCIFVFDQESIMQFEINPMGTSWYLHYLINPSARSYTSPSLIMNQYIEQFNDIDDDSYYFKVTPNDQISGQLFYAHRAVIEEAPYYAFINTPFELLDSTIEVLQRQFFLIIIGVLLLGGVIAYLISRLLSQPLIKMSNSALLLAKGRKNVNFEKGGYLEIDNLADTLNFATQEIAKTDNLRNDLLANISHDIRTPLTMISAYAEMIQDISGDDPEKRNQHLSVIQTEVEQLNKLLTDMMTLSQMQADTTRLISQEFDLNSIVQQVIESFKVVTSTQRVMIEVIGQINHLVVGDEIKVRQVIVNYISNAIKFIGDDGLVLVRLLEIEETGYARIEVEDHGDGIAMEDVPFVWDRYYKVNKNYQRARQGTGLGLAICKAICERGGYPYGVISEVGKGTTFFVEIPLKG